MYLRKILSLIIFYLLLFCPANSLENGTYRVIKIIDGDTLYLDFNNNNIAEQDEKVRLNGIDTFEVKPTEFLDYQIKNYGFTQDEALGLGYLGKEFAKKHLLNKMVKAVYSGEKETCDMGRHLMSIYFDNGKNYEEAILKLGLATVYQKSNLAPQLQKYEDLSKIKARAKQTHRLNLVLLNNKNGKYHKPTCEYGLMASDVELINLQKFTTYKPSSCCYEVKEKTFKSPRKLPIILTNQINLYFTNPTQNDFPKNECKNKPCKVLRNLILNANDTIDFALYGYNEQDDILNALIQVQQKGVKIRGVVDKDEAGAYRQTSKLKQNFNDIKVDSYVPIARKGQSQGFTRATQALMHNKFFIVDEQYVWTGSTNLSASCMTFNANNSVLIKSREIASIYSQEFSQMYEKGKFHTDKDLIPNTDNITLNNGYTGVSVYFSPKSEALTNYVRPLIKNAEKSIHISMFYLTHKRLVEDLIEAKNRGLDVKIILDGAFVGDGYSPHEKLREAKIPLKIENWKSKMHMKNAVIDNKYSILGSTNWTATAELVNDENMIIVDDIKIARQVEKNFQRLWKSIPNEWLSLTPEIKNRPQR